MIDNQSDKLQAAGDAELCLNIKADDALEAYLVANIKEKIRHAVSLIFDSIIRLLFYFTCGWKQVDNYVITIG